MYLEYGYEAHSSRYNGYKVSEPCERWMSAESTASPWSNGCSRAAKVLRDCIVVWTCSSEEVDCDRRYFASNHCDCIFKWALCRDQDNCLCAEESLSLAS